MAVLQAVALEAVQNALLLQKQEQDAKMEKLELRVAEIGQRQEAVEAKVDAAALDTKNNFNEVKEMLKMLLMVKASGTAKSRQKPPSPNGVKRRKESPSNSSRDRSRS